ncbi:hypothetical protein Salat_0707500 [Sesamum alatum]|uniref:Uncharacterized protein n=1 Tax=Sesamum alatum TaxID=300844 RepID=A0AAE2CUU6_9LAMI|nr:hypothetical protein Salat_0707500 [Sesamum alatum]
MKESERRVVQLDAEVETLKEEKMEVNDVVEELKQELSEFEVREEKLREKNMEACQVLEQLRQQMLAAEARTMRFDEAMKKMKQKESEAERTVQKLRREVLAGEEHKKMSDQMLDKMRAKESEDVRRMQELRKQNLEASRTVEELKQQVLAAEENKKMSDQAMEEMRARQTEDVRTMEELRHQHLEASYAMEELRQQVLAAEENKKMSDQAMEEMRARQVEDVRTVEELRHQHLEASYTIEELRQQILTAEECVKMYDQTVDALKDKRSEDIRTVEELKRQQYEASQAVEELSRQKLEAYNAAEIHKKRFENLAPMAEGLASLLKVNVDDLANLVTVEDKSVAAEGNEGLTFRVSKDGKQSLRNDGAEGEGHADVVVIVKSPGMRSTCNSSKNGYSLVPERGDRNLPESSWTKYVDINDNNAVQTSSSVQSDYATPQAERNYGDQENGSRKLQDSGRHAGSGLEFRMSASEQLMTQTWCSHELTPYYKDAGVIIDIIDSDDETTPDKPAYISTPLIQINEEKNDPSEVSLVSQKRKRIEFGIDEQKEDQNIVVAASDSRRHNFDGFNDRTPTLQRTWIFAADMLKAFEEDDELCMNAVCALYRQQVFESKYTGGFSGLLHHFEAMRARSLAEYLIGGDPELKQRKSVAEVKEEFPCALYLCRSLATDYYESLFTLYCNGDDPFFRSG